MLQPRGVWVAVELCTAFTKKILSWESLVLIEMLALFHLLKVSVSPNTSQVNSKSPGKYPDFISSSSSVRKFNPEQTKSKDILNLPNSEKNSTQKSGFFFLKTMLLSGLAGYLMFSFYYFGKVFTFERESTPKFIKII